MREMRFWLQIQYFLISKCVCFKRAKILLEDAETTWNMKLTGIFYGIKHFSKLQGVIFLGHRHANINKSTTRTCYKFVLEMFRREVLINTVDVIYASKSLSFM